MGSSSSKPQQPLNVQEPFDEKSTSGSATLVREVAKLNLDGKLASGDGSLTLDTLKNWESVASRVSCSSTRMRKWCKSSLSPPRTRSLLCLGPFYLRQSLPMLLRTALMPFKPRISSIPLYHSPPAQSPRKILRGVVGYLRLPMFSATPSSRD